MATIRSVRKPGPGRECPCGGIARAGIRYEATRTVDVRVCWDCGRETPPYGSSREVSPLPRPCRFCGEAFTTDDPRQRYCSADCAARADRIALDRRQTGGQLSRRPA